MRIISQDGRFDVPYELCAIYLNAEPIKGVTVRCRWQADQESSNVLAQYGSEENALIAMQMLHDAFNKRDMELADGRIYHYDCLFRFPSNKEINDSKESGDSKMTKEEFANGINGREIGSELTELEEQRAKENGLVVVFGASDDLMEFRGAIEDEGGCFDGGVVTFDGKGTSDDGQAHKNAIRAVWCGKDKDSKDERGHTIVWTYKTDIPHATFMVYEEGEPYCRGIVFSIKDIEL